MRYAPKCRVELAATLQPKHVFSYFFQVVGPACSNIGCTLHGKGLRVPVQGLRSIYTL